MYGIPDRLKALSAAEEQVLLAYGVYTMRQRLDTVFGGDLAQAVRALVSESGCSQSELEQAIAVLNEKHAEAEEYDLYDPYG